MTGELPEPLQADSHLLEARIKVGFLAGFQKILCYMELREGDTAKNQNIRSSRGSAE